MRTLIAGLSAAAAVAAAAAVIGPVSAMAESSASPTKSTTHVLNLTTKMVAFAPIDVPPAGPSAGDGMAIVGHVFAGSKRDGLATAHCMATHVKNPALMICTIDYALRRGLIATTAYSSNGGATQTLVIVGGTGAYAGVRGYGTLKPTSAG